MRKDLVTDNFKIRHYIYALETDPFRMKGVGFIDTWQKAKFARAPRRTTPGPMAAAVAQGGAGGPPLKLHTSSKTSAIVRDRYQLEAKPQYLHFYITFQEFGILRWIRNGDDIQNAFQQVVFVYSLFICIRQLNIVGKKL